MGVPYTDSRKHEGRWCDTVVDTTCSGQDRASYTEQT